MARLAMFLVNECEEVEALATVDVLRRADITVDMIACGLEKEICGSHGITFQADDVMASFDTAAYDGFLLPGGKGHTALKEDARVKEILLQAAKEEKLIAAICAAPTILDAFGLLEGKKATCFPAMKEQLLHATYVDAPAVTDGKVITGAGMGASFDFGLAIVAFFQGEEKAKALAESFVYRR